MTRSDDELVIIVPPWAELPDLRPARTRRERREAGVDQYRPVRMFVSTPFCDPATCQIGEVHPPTFHRGDGITSATGHKMFVALVWGTKKQRAKAKRDQGRKGS